MKEIFNSKAVDILQNGKDILTKTIYHKTGLWRLPLEKKSTKNKMENGLNHK